jgi:asparagine synthase (glutamine-hydrolysing)
MCGICAIWAYRPAVAPVARTELLAMREAMANRGPDGAGLWVSEDQRIGMAHRRLSILDLSEAGAQPMATPDGRLRVVFNGEIYNYRELRRNLQSQGHRFHSDSDTEILLYAYREYGQAMVHRLRGMFAFALWDEDRQGLLIARDHFGIKPLYYHDDGQTLRIASQVKALLAGGGVATDSEPAGHVGFYLWGCVPEPYTLYHNLLSLPAGHTLWVDDHGPRSPRPYFDIAGELEQAAELKGEGGLAHLALGAALRDSVAHHLISDVPIGVFLSSGLDSTTLTALATEASTRVTETNAPQRSDEVSGAIHAITLGFGEYEGTPNDEVPLARQSAEYYGCDHHVGRITRDDFNEELTGILRAMDQPTIDAVNTWFVAREAKRAGFKVAISGLGGDELLGSYPSFEHIPRIVATTRFLAKIPGLGRMIRMVSAPILRRSTSPKYASLFEYGGSYGGAYLLRRGMFMPWELPIVMDGDLVRQGWTALQPILRLDEWIAKVPSSRGKIAALEMAVYMRNMLLRDSDWAGMAHSLEIRVPFVDIGLFRALAPYLTAQPALSKRDLTGVPQRPLPQVIVNRPRTGFIVPIRDWTVTNSLVQSDRGFRGWATYVLNASKPRS